MDLLEHSVEKWKDLYFRGEQRRANSGMMFGRKMAEGLENEEATGDIVLDLLMERIPKFEIRDKAITAEMKNGKKTVIRNPRQAQRAPNPKRSRMMKRI